MNNLYRYSQNRNNSTDDSIKDKPCVTVIDILNKEVLRDPTTLSTQKEIITDYLKQHKAVGLISFMSNHPVEYCRCDTDNLFTCGDVYQCQVRFTEQEFPKREEI